jgi:hypothetical protein
VVYSDDSCQNPIVKKSQLDGAIKLDLKKCNPTSGIFFAPGSFYKADCVVSFFLLSPASIFPSTLSLYLPFFLATFSPCGRNPTFICNKSPSCCDLRSPLRIRRLGTQSSPSSSAPFSPLSASCQSGNFSICDVVLCQRSFSTDRRFPLSFHSPPSSVGVASLRIYPSIHTDFAPRTDRKFVLLQRAANAIILFVNNH